MRSRMPKRKLLTAAVAAALAGPAWADPPPRTDLPNVFCLRITDIERVAGDDDRFLFELEILNWTGQPASGFSVATNVGTSAGVTIVGAGVDSNGRGGAIDDTFGDIPVPGEAPPDPNPTESTPFMSGMGNVDTPNPWTVLQQDGSSAVWTDPDLNFDGYGGIFGSENELDSIDLLFGKGTPPRLLDTPLPDNDPNVTQTDNTGDTSIDGGDGVDLGDGSGYGGDVENALDGLVLDVDGFGEGDVLSLNWNLLAADFFDGGEGGGDVGLASVDGGASTCVADPDNPTITTDCFRPIGTSSGGNVFGFGMLNLTRAPTVDGFGPPVFENNVGFNQNPVLFFEKGGTSVEKDRTSVASIPNPTQFGGEIGAGQFGQFTPGSDLFNQSGDPNATFVALQSTAVPEPGTGSMLLAAGVLGAAFSLGSWRRRRTPRWA